MTIRAFEDLTPDIAASAYVDAQALVIGDVTLGEDASVWPMAVVRGDIQTITIGARTNIQDGSVVHVTHDSEYAPGGFATTVGCDVTVGHMAVLHACTVGDRCLIGIGARVLDGAVLEDETMLGAGSLVPPGKTLEGGHLWVGTPARKQRPLSERERTFLTYSAHHYVQTKNRHAKANTRN